MTVNGVLIITPRAICPNHKTAVMLIDAGARRSVVKIDRT